jgi:hypothetical protein
VRIQEALRIKEGADTIIQNHPDEYTDASIYNNVEDIYRQALVKLDDALTDKDSLDAGVVSSALQQQAVIKAALLSIYKNLDAGAEYVQSSEQEPMPSNRLSMTYLKTNQTKL